MANEWQEAYSNPEWYGKNTRLWTDWGHAGSEVPYENVKQDWYRAPSWGGHVVHNPYYGFQDYADVESRYSEAGGPVSWDDFKNWGLTPQTGSNWREYYPDRKTAQQYAAEGQTSGDQAFNWNDWWDQGQTAYTDWYGQQQKTYPQQGATVQGGPEGQGAQIPYGQPQQPYNTIQGSPEGQGGYMGMQLPQQWGTASDTMTGFAQGNPTPVPWQWQQGSDFASQMMASGAPTSTDPWYQSRLQDVQRNISDSGKDIAEQFGLMGLRKSTPLAQQLADMSGKHMSQFGTEAAGMEMQSLEAARQRQMAASGQLQGYGQGVSGLGESARTRGLASAQGLAGLGQQMFNAPMDWSQQLYGMGGGLQNIYQSALDRQMQEAMRMMPEYNPWLQGSMNYLGMPSQMQPQQYQNSLLGQLFGGASGYMPYAAANNTWPF